MVYVPCNIKLIYFGVTVTPGRFPESSRKAVYIFLEDIIIVILTMDTRYPSRNNELWRVFCEFKVWHTNSLFSLNTKIYFSTWGRALMRTTLINCSPTSVSKIQLKPFSYSYLCILLPVDFLNRIRLHIHIQFNMIEKIYSCFNVTKQCELLPSIEWSTNMCIQSRVNCLQTANRQRWIGRNYKGCLMFSVDKLNTQEKIGASINS